MYLLWERRVSHYCIVHSAENDTRFRLLTQLNYYILCGISNLIMLIISRYLWAFLAECKHWPGAVFPVWPQALQEDIQDSACPQHHSQQPPAKDDQKTQREREAWWSGWCPQTQAGCSKCPESHTTPGEGKHINKVIKSIRLLYSFTRAYSHTAEKDRVRKKDTLRISRLTPFLTPASECAQVFLSLIHISEPTRQAEI